MPTLPHSIASQGAVTSQPVRLNPRPESPRYPNRASAVWANAPARAATEKLLSAWHLCSLDAPTVAAIWVLFIAHIANITLPWTSPAAMFLAVWMLYAADRLLDARARRTGCSQPLELRHRFHQRHRRAFYAGLLLACPLLTLLLLHIHPVALLLYSVLGVLLAGWLLLVHLRPLSSRLPKELAVGIFFPAAVFIPSVARAPWLRLTFVPAALLFAAVCTLNCLYIFAWEHPHNRRNAHWTTRRATERLPQLTFATAVLSIATAALSVVLSPHARPIALPSLACAVSACSLLLVHSQRRRLSLFSLRVAADVCLLTPVLLLLPKQ